MNNHDDPEIEEARAMLEKYAEQMRRESKLSAQDLADLEKSLAGQSLLFGPRTELDFQRVLQDIRESGNED